MRAGFAGRGRIGMSMAPDLGKAGLDPTFRNRIETAARAS
jgi:3-hydroxyisobutyrate dehydrogenase-like beta-hydroxyacid dehydrogenase